MKLDITVYTKKACIHFSQIKIIYIEANYILLLSQPYLTIIVRRFDSSSR